MFSAYLLFICLLVPASAHFRLQYPTPRGPFVAQNEFQFCGNYTEVTTNRTSFPLSGGYINIQTGHPNWALGVIISTDSNPNTWGDFNVPGSNRQQFVKEFSNEPSAGTFCIPIDIKGAGIPDIKEGTNVTIQVVLTGSDGNLYQCADLSLSTNAVPPADPPCRNVTTV